MGTHPYENKRICIQEARFCRLCRCKGIVLYQDLRDRLFGAPGTWSLMRCPRCSLVWLNPRPIPVDIGKLYDTYFTHSANDHIPKLATLQKLIRNSILATHMGYNSIADGLTQKMLGRVLSLVGPLREIVELGVMSLHGREKGRLLDVGCGSGVFLARMRGLGWEVEGVEPDRETVKVAREQFGLSIHEGTLAEAGFPDDTFDAITMNHVIEHVWDPISTLQECRRVLKPGGKLVLITPNIESLGHRLFREAWRGHEVPRHLYLFSPRTLRTCAEQAGLKVLQLRTTARSARWIWEASRLIKRNGMLPGGLPKEQSLRLRLEGLTFQTVEHGLCRVGDMGEELVLVAIK